MLADRGIVLVYSVDFYQDESGKEPVFEYMLTLFRKNDKDSRIKLQKIQDYIRTLKEHGTYAGEPYIKHLDGPIWELRPLRDRITFAPWIDGGFLLLHRFMKSTRKTPQREIEYAKRLLANFYERRETNE